MLGYVSEDAAKAAYVEADKSQKNADAAIQIHPKASANIGGQDRFNAIVAWYKPNRDKFFYETHLKDAWGLQSADQAKLQFDELARDIVREAAKTGEAGAGGGAGGGGGGGPGGGPPDPDKIPMSTWIAAGAVGVLLWVLLNRSRGGLGGIWKRPIQYSEGVYAEQRRREIEHNRHMAEIAERVRAKKEAEEFRRQRAYKANKNAGFPDFGDYEF